MYKLKFLLIFLFTNFLKFLGDIFFYLGRSTIGLISYKFIKGNTTIVIETGIKAVESVYFEELYNSLIEFSSKQNKIFKLIIHNRSSYIREVLRKTIKQNTKFYIYDPRTGSQNKFIGLIQVLLLSFYFGIKKTIPIVSLTDASIRQWRLQAAALTGSRGIIFTFMDPKQLGILTKGIRIIGPCLMPLSKKTFEEIQSKHVDSVEENNKIYFCGSLYPERLTFLRELTRQFDDNKSNISLILEEKSNLISAEKYWNNLKKYRMIITTTFQQPSSNYIFDKPFIDQVVFRITEALACKRVLITPTPPGMKKLLEPNVDYIEITGDVKISFEVLKQLMNDQEKIFTIAEKGNLKLQEYVFEKKFWLAINNNLNTSLIQ